MIIYVLITICLFMDMIIFLYLQSCYTSTSEVCMWGNGLGLPKRTTCRIECSVLSYRSHMFLFLWLLFVFIFC